jgi:hypothetical protein
MVLPVSDDVLGVLFSGSSVYFQIWKVRLCHMKYSNKIGKKNKNKNKKRMVVSIVGALLSGSMSGFSAHTLKRKSHPV